MDENKLSLTEIKILGSNDVTTKRIVDKNMFSIITSQEDNNNQRMAETKSNKYL